MAGIQGINGVPEPTPERPATARDRRRVEGQAPESRDGVEISPEAKEAANVQRLADLAKNEPDIRADRVAVAKERLERGEYKDLNVLRQVARELMKYLT